MLPEKRAHTDDGTRPSAFAPIRAVRPEVKAKTAHMSSYGMNDFVPPRDARGGQLLLADYSDAIIRLEDSMGLGVHDPFDGDLDNGEIMDRHLGRASLVQVDGSVSSMTKDQLRLEYERLPDRESLWAK